MSMTEREQRAIHLRALLAKAIGTDPVVAARVLAKTMDERMADALEVGGPVPTVVQLALPPGRGSSG